MGRARPFALGSDFRTLIYTVHFLVFALLVQSGWGQKQATRSGMHTSRSSLAPLSPSHLYRHP